MTFIQPLTLLLVAEHHPVPPPFLPVPWTPMPDRHVVMLMAAYLDTDPPAPARLASPALHAQPRCDPDLRTDSLLARVGLLAGAPWETRWLESSDA